MWIWRIQWLGVDLDFEYDFSIICQAIKKTKNIGQCEVYYNSRSYKDGKKCTWDVGIYAFKRIIIDRFF